MMRVPSPPAADTSDVSVAQLVLMGPLVPGLGSLSRPLNSASPLTQAVRKPAVGLVGVRALMRAKQETAPTRSCDSDCNGPPEISYLRYEAPCPCRLRVC